VNKHWLDYNQLTFSVKAPEGHLPGLFEILFLKSNNKSKVDLRLFMMEVSGVEQISSFVSRLVGCNI
jgi:hypothetical protein